jgi:hypothetical protein
MEDNDDDRRQILDRANRLLQQSQTLRRLADELLQESQDIRAAVKRGTTKKSGKAKRRWLAVGSMRVAKGTAGPRLFGGGF